MKSAFLCAVLLTASALPAADPAQPCPGNNGAPSQVLTGAFDTSLEGAYVMVPFEVPEGQTRVRVKLCYDQPPSPTSSQIKHTLDLGIYDASTDGLHDANEFRGWGGSSRPNVLVTPEEATGGFNPGPIPAGEWAAEIGVAAVAGPEEGDPDGSVGWRLEVFFAGDPSDTDEPWLPATYDTTPANDEAGWYKGDFHVHAEHSARDDAPMRETFDYAFGDRPKGAGLDFITLSDYVGTRHWDEIGRLQADYPRKLIIRSAEVITYRGHINNHASATYVDHRTGPVYELRSGTLQQIRGERGAREILDGIHDGGGFTQVNHPTTFPSWIPFFSNLCRGCSYDYSDAQTDWSKVDAMEVQTGPAGTPGPDRHELGPNPFTPLAIQWWDELRAAGHRITAVGSSDSHHAGETNGPTQSPIGEATTVVYAEELSERGIHAAVEAGHAYVKFFSSDGPDLRFEASPLDKPGNGRGRGPRAIMGDRLKSDEATFEAKVLGAVPDPDALGGGPGAEPRTLVVLRDGQPFLVMPVTEAEFKFTFTAAQPGDYRLQLQRGSAIEALTNPITLTPR